MGFAKPFGGAGRGMPFRPNSGLQKNNVSQVQKLNTGNFARRPLNRRQADWQLAKEIFAPENVNLCRKLQKYNPKKSGETKLQYAGRLNQDLFGGIKDPAYTGKTRPIGTIIGDQQDKDINFPMREKRIRHDMMHDMRTGNYREAQKKKVNLELFDKFTGRFKK